MKITINKVDIEEKISSRTNKPYLLQKYIVEFGQERRIANIFIKSQDEAYPVGNYTIHEDSFKVNDFGSLEVGFLKLKKLAA